MKRWFFQSLQWAKAHAGCRCDGREGCRYSGYNHLQDQFEDFSLFHKFEFNRFKKFKKAPSDSLLKGGDWGL